MNVFVISNFDWTFFFEQTIFFFLVINWFYKFFMGTILIGAGFALVYGFKPSKKIKD